MNNQLRKIVEQAVSAIDIVTGNEALDDELAKMYIPDCFAEKFAELIVRECVKIALDEIVADEEIDKSDDIEDRCYLRGNNGGIVDAVVAIKQHFGVEE